MFNMNKDESSPVGESKKNSPVFFRKEAFAIFFISIIALASCVFFFISAFQDKNIEIFSIDKSSSIQNTYKLKIDINNAPAARFELIPGIGEKLSLRIVRYRESVGYFTSVDELVRIKGISTKLLRKIRTYLKCENIQTQNQPQ